MKKNRLLLLLLLLLAAGYAVYFTTWFQPRTIHIFHTWRPLHPRLQRDGVLPSLQFGLDRRYPLTEIKVLPLVPDPASPYPLPLWHLVSGSNSVPVMTFYYGQNLRGLQPQVPGSRPQPLATNVAYRLCVTAGKYHGENIFVLK